VCRSFRRDPPPHLKNLIRSFKHCNHVLASFLGIAIVAARALFGIREIDAIFRSDYHETSI
jgi:hypothetical protein